jgi:hypothetical protein
VAGRAGHTGTVEAVFNTAGRVALIASTAPRHLAGGVAPGARARRLTGRARRLMPGVWVGRRLRAGVRYIYGVRSGRVRFVAVTTAAEVRSTTRLRSDLQAAGV